MKSLSLTFCTLMVMLGFASACPAQLILNVNPTDDTFSFTGSATGTTFDFAGFGGVVSWSSSGVLPTDSSAIGLNNDLAFTTTLGTPGNTLNNIDTNIQGGGGTLLVFTLYISQNGPTTLTGLNNFQSYAGLSALNQAKLESLIGTNVPLSNGTGLGGLSVVGVPEPSSMTLCGTCLAPTPHQPRPAWFESGVRS